MNIFRDIKHIRTYRELGEVLNKIETPSIPYFFKTENLRNYNVIFTKYDDGWHVFLQDHISEKKLPLERDEEIEAFQRAIIQLALLEMLLKDMYVLKIKDEED